MKAIWIAAGVAALVFTGAALGQSALAPLKVGDEFELTRSYETSDKSSDGMSSGSSSGHDAILKRVVAVRSEGLELEYDLPKGASADDRARAWQFPARVFIPTNGPTRLLNATALDARLDEWLRAARWSRDMCGRWIFTWNAFQIQCDPQSVVATIEGYELSGLRPREGDLHREPGTLGSGTISRRDGGAGRATLVAVLRVDPDSVRRERAESDVAVGEMLRKPVTLETALQKRAKEQVAGKMTVTFETNAVGAVVRRTRRTEIVTTLGPGRTETRTATEVVEGRRAAP